MLRSDFCDYIHAYVCERKYWYRPKRCRSCITKTNSTLIGNAEDPNIVIPMHNLLECSQNYHRDEINVQKKMFIIMLQMVNDSNIRQK